jgi:hypothetical protein
VIYIFRKTELFELARIPADLLKSEVASLLVYGMFQPYNIAVAHLNTCMHFLDMRLIAGDIYLDGKDRVGTVQRAV